ncbi:MAG: class IV adenylate cyclase [Methanobrevibacter sp.]|jgi:adenylate cyclase class 2|nr:class IV adenylate cyclase [Candidatus Methanovirga australis]
MGTSQGSDKLIEVEVKSKVKEFESIKKRLKELKIDKISEEIQEDIYLERYDIEFAKNDKAFRIRKITKKNGNSTVITYKGPKIDEISKTREEIEIAVEDGDKILKIFERLGFYKGGFVKKTREIYKFDEFIISLDDVEGLDPYIEIEVDLEDDLNYQESIAQIYEIFNKLNISSGFERTSYLELLQLKK